jgi:carboxymethylenebutenolidase
VGSEVRFANGGDERRGWLALPASGRGPGVIVIQEWWGLVDHIKDVCERFAREGFVALAPDLYRGERAGDPDTAGRLMMDLDIPRAARDLDAAVDFLLGHDAVEGGKLGVIGFCMGGQLALLAACRNPRLGAVVDYYGIHPNVTLDPSGLRAPVLGIFAERDAFVPPAAARALQKQLEAAGVRADFRIFNEVDHAFANDTRPDVFNARAAAEAWTDTLNFFRAELR